MPKAGRHSCDIWIVWKYLILSLTVLETSSITMSLVLQNTRCRTFFCILVFALVIMVTYKVYSLNVNRSSMLVV